MLLPQCILFLVRFGFTTESSGLPFTSGKTLSWIQQVVSVVITYVVCPLHYVQGVNMSVRDSFHYVDTH